MRTKVSFNYWMYGIFPGKLIIEVGLTDEEIEKLKPVLKDRRNPRRLKFIEDLAKEHFFNEPDKD